MKNFQSETSWYNFKTKQYDYRKIDTDEIAIEAIEQIEPLIAIYHCYRDLGDNIQHALIKTLKHQLTIYK
jgi:hypothetical protein